LLTTVLLCSGCGPDKYREIYNRTKVEADVKKLIEVAHVFCTLRGSYPESVDVMLHATDKDGNEESFIIEKPIDPWGREYHYEIRDGHPVAYCLGRDGKPGGYGDDKDFHWPPEDRP
jgi:hypothetical protein